MSIVVCCKLVPDTKDIQVKENGSISIDKAEWIVGDFDLVAIEAGFQLAEKNGKKLIALSAGNNQLSSSKAKKTILARGPAELVIVTDEAMTDADTHMTAQVLAGGIKKISSYDLVICGEGSSDLYFQQVGLQLGEMLGVPTINGISEIIEMTGDKLVAKRSTEEEIETVEIPLPAVISVTADICQSRIPKMQDILKAGKKPVAEYTFQDVGGGQHQSEVVSLKAPQTVERKQIVLDGATEEAVKALLLSLAQDGVL